MPFIVSYYHDSRDFKNNETESNLLVYKENTKYEVLFFGTSHGRVFSRYNNHKRVEKILNKKVINLSQGSGRGSFDVQLLHLKYFLSKGNSTKMIVLFLSPHLMFSPNIKSLTTNFDNEPLRLDFLMSLINSDIENKNLRIFEYYRSKLNIKWLFLKKDKTKSRDKGLKKVDYNKLIKKLKLSYNKGEKRFDPDSEINLDFEVFEENAKQLENLINFCGDRDLQFIIIIPPFILEQFPGQDYCLEYLNKKGYLYYDYSKVYNDQNLFLDYHHLNTSGVVKFTENYLKAITNKIIY